MSNENEFNISMSGPDLSQAEIDSVVQVLQSRWLSLGPKTDEFEAAIADYVGSKYAISVNSGTSGLHLAVIAAGISDGDEVITSPFSFVASANCILYERGKPVFVDVNPRSGNIDPNAIEAAITERTRAILPVHAFGQPSDMDAILEIARRHDLKVIEDACESIGAEFQTRLTGKFGDAAVFAFYPNKQMTTGEGGVIVTDNEEWNDLFRSLRNQGRDVFDAWLNHTRLGYNYRLDEMSAALGLVQLKRLDELLAKREQVAMWYNKRLTGLELVDIPHIMPTTTRMSWFVYVVRIKPPASRDQVMAKLVEHAIPSRPYFAPIHLQPFYVKSFGYQHGDFPITEHLGDVSLALPFSSVMTEKQVGEVCDALVLALE